MGKLERRDILEVLQVYLANNMRPGTADSDINTWNDPIVVTRGDVYRAIKEIECLREDQWLLS